MKDLSSFLKTNSMTSHVRKGFSNSCNGQASTSTLDQQKPLPTIPSSADVDLPKATTSSNNNDNMDSPRKSVTLEEMIKQLDLEEALFERRAKVDNNLEHQQRRMSCVDNADNILLAARNALNQYPRFSLDGKDAMHRSSFRRCRQLQGEYSCKKGTFDLGGLLKLPQSVGGESVVWRKPGVVAKLMGLDAMPVPIRSARANRSREIMEHDQETDFMLKGRRLRRGAQRREPDHQRGFHYADKEERRAG